MSKLFSPIKLRDLEVRNRIFLAPMCQYAIESKDGVVGDYHLVHLGARAMGGFGMVIAEATAVVPEGRISPWCPGIWSDEQAVAWSRVTEYLHRFGAKTAIQLAHAGRKASTYRDGYGKHGSVPISEGGWQTVSPGPDAFEGYDAPRELTESEVEQLPLAFAAAAKRAISAGFDAVEIHAAHGYLIHQFLSPITNKRKDSFGGSLEGRAKLLIDVIKAVRAEIGEKPPVLVRLSATDYREDGWTPEENAIVSGWAEAAGADLLDISSGGLITGVKIPTGPGYQVAFSEQVAAVINAPVSAVGQITEARQAEAILESTKVEVIMIGRAGLRDPHWPLRAANELGVEIDYWPTNYLRGKWPLAR